MDQNLQLVESQPPASDDLALARQAGQDSHAFAQIMRRYNQRLFRLAVGLMGDASEAEDVLQESYVRAFYRLSSFAGKASLGTWLARIVRNEAIDRLRARRMRSGTLMLEADFARVDGLPSIVESTEDETALFNPETSVARDDMRSILEQAIGALPEHFRSVFLLREVEGLSVKETADYLEIPVATVKTRDHRARSLLRTSLETRIDAATRQAFPFLGTRCDMLVARVLARLQQ
jgi:RNA polymerase sigma-70 factor (ECF subfamily)